MRRAAPLLLVLLLAAPALSVAAASPNSRPAPLATLAPVSEVAVAENGFMLAAAGDPGSSLAGPGGPPANANSWFIWDRAGLGVNAGSSDLTNCGTRVGDTCKTPAKLASYSGDGNRWAIGASPADAPADAVLGVVVMGGTSSGVKQRYAFDNVLADVSLDRTGSKLAVTEQIAAAVGGSATGQVQLFTWDGAGSPAKVFTAPQAVAKSPAQSALSSDGKVYAVAAGALYRFPFVNAGPTAHQASSGTPLSVAIAGDAPHTIIGGYDDGTVVVMNDASPVGPYYSRKPGTSPVRAVAVQGGGNTTLFAAGDDAGKLYLFTTHSKGDGSGTGQLLATLNAAPDAIQQLAFSPSGSILALRSLTTVVLYQVEAAGLQQLWKETPAKAPASLALDLHGDLLAVGNADGVVVYDALHQVQGSSAGATISAAGTQELTVRFENGGNRPEALRLETAAPNAWNVTLGQDTLALPAGQSGDVRVKVKVPANQAPGRVEVEVGFMLASGGKGVVAVPVTVPVDNRLTLEEDGAASVAVEPGGTTILHAKVRNRGNLPADTRLSASVDLPGWSVAVSPREATLAPGQAQTVVVTLSAANAAREGDRGHVKLFVSQHPDDPLDLYGTVGARFGVMLKVPAGISVPPGNITRFEARVVNTGNTIDSFTLALGSVPAGWVAIIDEGGQTAQANGIAAGATATFGVTVRAPSDAVVGSRSQISLVATSLADSDRRSEQRLQLSVGVSATTTTKEGPAPDVALLAAALVALAFAIRLRKVA